VRKSGYRFFAADKTVIGLVARRDLLRVRANLMRHESEREILLSFAPRPRPQPQSATVADIDEDEDFALTPKAIVQKGVTSRGIGDLSRRDEVAHEICKGAFACDFLGDAQDR
jgi:hypothetical protein